MAGIQEGEERMENGRGGEIRKFRVFGEVREKCVSPASLLVFIALFTFRFQVV
jgi:hypothetical protein